MSKVFGHACSVILLLDAFGCCCIFVTLVLMLKLAERVFGVTYATMLDNCIYLYADP